MSLTCPICEAPLEGKREPKSFFGDRVRDGNACYQCRGLGKHEFWAHPFSHRIYHYNATGVDETSYHFTRRWELTQAVNTHVWKELPREDPKPEPAPAPPAPKLSFTIGSAGVSTDEFRTLIHKAEDCARQQQRSVAAVVAEALTRYFDTLPA